MEQIIIETVSKHTKFKKGVGGSSQHGQIMSDQSHCFLWYEVLWTRKRHRILYTLALARPLTQSLIVYLSLNWWDTGSASRWWVENWLDAQTQSCDQGCWCLQYAGGQSCARRVLDRLQKQQVTEMRCQNLMKFNREMQGPGPGEEQQPHAPAHPGADQLESSFA